MTNLTFNMMKTVLLSLLLSLTFPLTGQQMLGLSSSNYAGIDAIYWNPASLANSPVNFHLNLFSVNAHFNNNYLSYQKPILKFIKDDPSFNHEYFGESVNGEPKVFFSGAELRGPGILISLNRKHGFAITTRVRAYAHGNNITEELMELIWKGSDNAVKSLANTNQQGMFNGNVIGEGAISYGIQLWENDRHLIKAGASVKRLWGFYSNYAHLKDLDYQVMDNNGATYLAIENLALEYGYTQGVSDTASLNLMDFTKNAPGKGWGYDLGLAYEWYPKAKNDTTEGGEIQVMSNEKKLYKLKLSVAVLDIGKLNYGGIEDFKAYRISRKNIQISADNLEEMDVEEVLDVQPSEQLHSYQTSLPTALNINLDYRLTKKLYANLVWIKALHDEKGIGMHQQNVLALTPRLQTKSFELAIPLALHKQYEQMTLGLYLRLGPLFIGSNNLNALIGRSEVYRTNVYMGISFRGFQ